MISLLVIADDFTGALDTGVQFASSGIATNVLVNLKNSRLGEFEGLQVLVIDAETRHLSREDAKVWTKDNKMLKFEQKMFDLFISVAYYNK